MVGRGFTAIRSGDTGFANTLEIGNGDSSTPAEVAVGGGTLYTGYTNIGIAGSGGTFSMGSGVWNSDTTRVGYGGQGTLVVYGGTVTNGITEVGSLSDAVGTLQLSGGVYITDKITEGAGRGRVIFSGGTVRATHDTWDFFSGFEAGDLTISSGGARIDSNGYSVRISSVLSGGGSLVKIGAGSLTLTGANTYSGVTIVNAGKLILDHGSIGAAPYSSNALIVGESAGDDGTLGVYNGGSISANYAPDGIIVGKAAGSKGTVVVNGGTMQADGEMTVGMSGKGSVSLYDGTISARYSVLGYVAGSEGQVSVQGGTWQAGGSTYLGQSGKGTLEITGGTVSADEVTLAWKTGSQGLLIIGSTTDHQGVLETSDLRKGVGSAQVRFQGGILRANRDYSSFFVGMADGEVITEGRGAYLDTNGQSDVRTGGGLSGSGQVVKLGAGTLRMEYASTYSGGTMVMEGTLANGNRAAFGTGLVTIDGGTLQAYDATIYGIALKSGTLEISPFGQYGLTLTSGTSFSMTGGTWSLYQMGPGMHGTFLGDATNTFSITGGTLDLFGAIVHPSISYQLFQGFGSGSVSGLTITGYDTTRYLANLGNDGLLTFAAVPESQTIVLVLAGGLCLAMMRRRMRRSACEG